jgi:hypothetical protein
MKKEITDNQWRELHEQQRYLWWKAMKKHDKDYVTHAINIADMIEFLGPAWWTRVGGWEEYPGEFYWGRDDFDNLCDDLWMVVKYKLKEIKE